jgi:hypothetical protein
VRRFNNAGMVRHKRVGVGQAAGYLYKFNTKTVQYPYQTATQTNAANYAVTANFVPTDTANYNSLLGFQPGNFEYQQSIINSGSSRVTGAPRTAQVLAQSPTMVWVQEFISL